MEFTVCQEIITYIHVILEHLCPQIAYNALHKESWQEFSLCYILPVTFLLS